MERPILRDSMSGSVQTLGVEIEAVCLPEIPAQIYDEQFSVSESVSKPKPKEVKLNIIFLFFVDFFLLLET